MSSRLRALPLVVALALAGVARAEDPDAGLNAPWNQPPEGESVPGTDPDAGLNAPWTDPAVFCAAYESLPDQVKRMNRARWLRECRDRPKVEDPRTLPDLGFDYSVSLRLGFPVRIYESDRQKLELEIHGGQFVAGALGVSPEVRVFFSEKDLSKRTLSPIDQRRRSGGEGETFLVEERPTIGAPAHLNVELPLPQSVYDTAYWCAEVDPNERIRESNERNNVACTPVAPPSWDFASAAASTALPANAWLRVDGLLGPVVEKRKGENPVGRTPVQIDWSHVLPLLAEGNKELLGSYVSVRRGLPWPKHVCQELYSTTWDTRNHFDENGPYGHDLGGFFGPGVTQTNVQLTSSEWVDGRWVHHNEGNVFYVSACLWIFNGNTGRQSFGYGSHTIEVKLLEGGLDTVIEATWPQRGMDLSVESLSMDRDGAIRLMVGAEWEGDAAAWFRQSGVSSFPFEWEVLVGGQLAGRGTGEMDVRGGTTIHPASTPEAWGLWVPGPGAWEVRARVHSEVPDANPQNNQLTREFIGVHIDEPHVQLSMETVDRGGREPDFPVNLGSVRHRIAARAGWGGYDLAVPPFVGPIPVTTCAAVPGMVKLVARGLNGSVPIARSTLHLLGTEQKRENFTPPRRYTRWEEEALFDVSGLRTADDRRLEFVLTLVDEKGKSWVERVWFRLPGLTLALPSATASPGAILRSYARRVVDEEGRTVRSEIIRPQVVPLEGSQEVEITLRELHGYNETVQFRANLVEPRGGSCLAEQFVWGLHSFEPALPVWRGPSPWVGLRPSGDGKTGLGELHAGELRDYAAIRSTASYPVRLRPIFTLERVSEGSLQPRHGEVREFKKFEVEGEPLQTPVFTFKRGEELDPEPIRESSQ